MPNLQQGENISSIDLDKAISLVVLVHSRLGVLEETYAAVTRPVLSFAELCFQRWNYQQGLRNNILELLDTFRGRDCKLAVDVMYGLNALAEDVKGSVLQID